MYGRSYDRQLYGAILGDIAGSIYEFKPLVKGSDSKFDIHDPRGYITDDSLLTLAMADSIANEKDTVAALKEWSVEYDTDPNHRLGWGLNYAQWIHGDYKNDSWGNGALMRVSPFMWWDDLEGAIMSTAGSHEHYQSVLAIIKLYNLYCCKMAGTFVPYEKPFTHLDESCAGTIKIIENLWEMIWHEGAETQNIIEYTVRLNGDCDTNASIIGAVSNYHLRDITNRDVEYVRSKLDSKQLKVLDKFNSYV